MFTKLLSLAAVTTCLLISLATSGCLTHRTIKEGNEVVAEGYVVKPPLAPLIAD